MPASGPTGEELIGVSRSFNLLCQPMFVMTTFPRDGGMGPVMEHMEPHLAYWAEMEQKKVMFAAGPVMPASSAEPWSGHGMVIFRAPSLSAAKSIADADPMHAAGAREYDSASMAVESPEDVTHLTRAELEAGLDEIGRAPAEEGTLVLIVRRPATNDREVLEEGTLDVERGLVGDRWSRSGPGRRGEAAHRDSQLNVMSARVIGLIAQDRERWPLAGDQLFVDLDLSEANLPPGTRLAIGTAVIEVTAEPHTGCGKFVSRFGVDAMKFVNSPTGRELRMRGLNARVVTGGAVRPGDPVKKLAPTMSR